jgi:tRNA dimethylallyltransferase
LRAPLAIVGPTATGKSALAVELAEQMGRAEIISVDSMQVYRGMDIGTAKATSAEQARVPHHLIDVLDPSEECSVSWFQQSALDARAAVASHEAVALFVGGTGLYHRAVIDELEIPGQWPDVLADLETEPDTEALHDRLVELDPAAAQRIESSNRRRTLRALEVTLGAGRPFSSFGPGLAAYPDSEIVQVGLALDRDVMATRIESRFRDQMRRGFVEEVARLDADEHGWSRTAEQALGYRELLRHLRDGDDLDDCVADAITRTRQFAVRQDRWFRRDPRITWFAADDPDLMHLVEAHWLER